MSKLSIGIVGLPNVGKSTLFKVLTKQNVDIANYPFCTINPNIGIVIVPDERLEKLTSMSKSAKTITAVVEFYDIAGLVRGANKGEGLGNKFLSHIKEVNAIVMVLRCFASEEIIHVENSVDPIRDLEIINTELILKDLETIENRLNKVGAEARGNKKEAIQEVSILEQIKEILQKNNLITEFSNNPFVKNLNLLTSKKQIYLLNGYKQDIQEKLLEIIRNLNGNFIIANLLEEADLQNSLSNLIKETYSTLKLISFFTTGEQESRAWTITQGTKAPQAAGVIHTDFEKKFIRTETVNWENLLNAGSWVAAKSKGLIHIEGKEYIMQDGDVVLIRHS